MSPLGRSTRPPPGLAGQMGRQRQRPQPGVAPDLPVAAHRRRQLFEYGAGQQADLELRSRSRDGRAMTASSVRSEWEAFWREADQTSQDAKDSQPATGTEQFSRWRAGRSSARRLDDGHRQGSRSCWRGPVLSADSGFRSRTRCHQPLDARHRWRPARVSAAKDLRGDRGGHRGHTAPAARLSRHRFQLRGRLKPFGLPRAETPRLQGLQAISRHGDKPRRRPYK